MDLRNVLCALVIGGITGTTAGGTEPQSAVDSTAAFAMLKQLEGTWEAPTRGGKTALTRFELTAGGTVLLERYSNAALPGGGHMATAYHLDSGELVLTHYCIANNQPVLRAERFDPVLKEIQFEFIRAGNLPSPASGHMRRAKYRIVDANSFVTEWEFFENGTRKMAEVESFTRVK